MAGEKAFDRLQDMLTGLSGGQPELCDIWVRLFSVEMDNVMHGLFYEQSTEDLVEGEEPTDWVMLEPQDIMFHPPWDSSEYSS